MPPTVKPFIYSFSNTNLKKGHLFVCVGKGKPLQPLFIRGEERTMASKRQKKQGKNRAFANSPVPPVSVNPFEEKWARSRNAAIKRQARQAATRPSTNKFIDKRIGEYDPAVSDADRYLLRLQRERSVRHKRSARFNLEDHDDYEEDHGEAEDDHGGALNVEDPTSGQYGPDDPDGDLDHVDADDEDELFTRKKPRLNDDEIDSKRDETGEEDRPKSKQEVMHDLIQKTKVHKEEKKREKRHVEVETLRLDTGLQDIMELLNKAESDFDAESKKSIFDKPPPPAAPDNNKPFQYEAAYNMLAQEKRARPTQRLLTDEEIAERERERLIELEHLRKQRMNSLDDSAPVDDLSDKRGTKLSGADDIADSFNLPTDGDGGVESGEDEDVANAEDGKSLDTGAGQYCLKRSSVWFGPSFWEAYCEDQILASAEESREIPFVFEKCPAKVSELAEVFRNTTISQRIDILDRLRKCFAISLDPGRNRAKLERLTECLLFWIERLCEVSGEALPNAVKEIDALLPQLHTLGTPFEQLVGSWAGRKITDCAESLKDTMAPLSTCWRTSNVLVLRCVSQLFPSSDLRHGVMTPLALLLSEALSSVRMYRLVDVAYGVFVAYVLVDVLGVRKGFSPELIQFICDIFGALSDNADRPTKGNHLGDVFSRVDDTLPKEGPLRLADCVRMHSNAIGEHEIQGLTRKVLNGIMAISEVIFDRWVPHPDIALAQVHVDHIRLEWVRKRVEGILNARKKERAPLSLYTKRERIIVKAVNPRMSSSTTGVFHKRGRSIPGIEPSMKEAAASANRVRKALRKEVRKLARDVRTEADVAAGQAFAEETVRRKKADAKDQKVRAFFEHQRSTWRAAEKQQKRLSRKRW